MHAPTGSSASPRSIPFDPLLLENPHGASIEGSGSHVEAQRGGPGRRLTTGATSLPRPSGYTRGMRITATRATTTPRCHGVEDHIVVLRGATWADYQRLLEIRGDRSAPRIRYLEGSVEIMRPSRFHESLKSVIGCLLEAWCMARGVEFTTLGAWTQEDKALDRGAEPDECYVFGEPDEARRPDLVIEVIWTHGGLDKLEIYRKLGVREVWIWKDDLLSLFALRGEAYEEVARSEVLPDLDVVQLAGFLDRRTTSQAIRDYRKALDAP